MAVLILANILFFIMTAVSLCRVGTTIHNKDDASIFYSKQKFVFLFFFVCFFLFCFFKERSIIAAYNNKYINK